MSSAEKRSMSENLTITVTVHKSAKEVYDAIKDVKAWWVGDVVGDAQKVGSEFTYEYKEFHASRQKVTELIPNKRVVWHVEDATISFLKDKKEWQGTNIVFEIHPRGDRTEIRFTHQGLAPEVECFEACSGGWDFYIRKSLVNLLTKGKGLDPGF